MTAEEFRSLIFAWHGSPHGAQTALAKALGVAPRTIRRACQNGPPKRLLEAVRREVGLRDEPFTCRAEWVLGDSPDDKEYLIHAWPPRFIARVVSVDEIGDPDASEGEVSLSGVVYQSEGFMICEFVWLDAPPKDIVTLMEQACDIIDSA